MDDRNTYKKGKVPDKFSGADLDRRPLRNLFISEEDALIAKIICILALKKPSSKKLMLFLRTPLSEAFDIQSSRLQQ